MVQFTLPKNSKITVGKVWPRSPMAEAQREYRILITSTPAIAAR